MAKETGGIPKQCNGKRKDGRKCTAPALASGFCFAHDPAMAEARNAARKKGGQNRSAAVRMRGLVPPRLASVYDSLETALAEVHDGTLDSKQANAMASLARAMVAVLTSGELEERVRALEGKAGA